MKNTGAIIQARMGSARLPGKILALLLGKPLLQHVLERVRLAQQVNTVVLATTLSPGDDPAAALAKSLGVLVFRGSEDDVLDRFYQAALRYRLDPIVRVTSDCPLLDPRIVDSMIDTYSSGMYDYVANSWPNTYPDGLDVEVFSFHALEEAWRNARLATEREHVTSYIRNSGTFKTHNVAGPENLSEWKWSVDTESDLAFVRSVMEILSTRRQPFYYEDVLAVLRDHPELLAINQNGVVNEGYYKSLTSDPPIPARSINISRSIELKRKAERLIPSTSQTFSKGPTQFVQGVAPVFLVRGRGSHVWDVDGNEFIDYPMGLGPVILGHDYPAVTHAAVEQLHDGLSFSLPHPLEAELAELLVEIIPCAEMVRFGKNGSDATSGAVRAARAYTGRDVIACCGYHGWQDWYIGTTTRNRGVPDAVRDLTIPFRYNDISSLEQVFANHPGKVAAVIMEPFGVEEPKGDFLRQVLDVTHREGALLIFDEIVTGFRMSMGGAQEYYGVRPDLACFGKAMANGFPISAVVGRRDVMELFDEIFFSFTFGGEAVSLAAALATIREMRDKRVIDHLWGQGRIIKDGYNTLAKEYGIDSYTTCIGLGPRTVITFKDASGAESLLLKSLYQQECIRRGILTAGFHLVCFSHAETDVDYTLHVYRTVLEIMSLAIREGDVASRLDGAPVQSVFRRV